MGIREIIKDLEISREAILNNISKGRRRKGYVSKRK